MGMYMYWMLCLAAINLGVTNGIADSDNANTNDNILISSKKARDKIDVLVGELDKQKGITFNGNDTVLKEASLLVTFGKVYKDYEGMYELSQNIQNLEKEKKIITKQLDEEIEKLNARIDKIVQTSDPSIHELAYIFSAEKCEINQLVDDLNDEDTLETVKSAFPQITQKHVDRWNKLKELNKTVETLKEQHGYGNFIYLDKVDRYLIEYEKARKWKYCKEFIANTIEAIETDHYEMKRMATLLSVAGVKSMNLEKLKKKLHGNDKNVKDLLDQIRSIKYLQDFTPDELDKFGIAQGTMNSHDALINIIREKKEKQKVDVIAKIMGRLAQIKNEGVSVQPVWADNQVEYPNDAYTINEDSSTLNPLEQQTLMRAQEKLRTMQPNQDNQQPTNYEYLDTQNVGKAQPIYPQLDQLTEEQQQQLDGFARMQTTAVQEVGTSPSAPYMDEQQLYQYYQQQQAIDQARANAQQELAMQQFGFKMQHMYPQWQQQSPFQAYARTQTMGMPGMHRTSPTPYLDQQQLYQYYQQQQAMNQGHTPYRQGNPYNFQYYNRYPLPFVQQSQPRQLHRWPHYVR